MTRRRNGCQDRLRVQVRTPDGLPLSREGAGRGDYSTERHEIFAGLTIDELLKSIEPAKPETP